MKFIIDGPPIPKQSARHGKYRVYNPQLAEMNQCKAFIRNQLPQDFVTFDNIPLYLQINFFMTIPQSLSTKKQEALNNHYHLKKPDTDNLTKWVKDILTGAGVYRDDSLVATEVIQKIYSHHPRTELSIVPAPPLSILYENHLYTKKDNSNGK